MYCISGELQNGEFVDLIWDIESFEDLQIHIAFVMRVNNECHYKDVAAPYKSIKIKFTPPTESL